MSNAIMFWADTIKSQGAFYQPTGQGRWPSIDPADIAACRESAAYARSEGQAYTLTGDEPMNGTQYAEVLSRVLGKPIKFVDVPPDVAKEGMFKEWYARRSMRRP